MEHGLGSFVTIDDDNAVCLHVLKSTPRHPVKTRLDNDIGIRGRCHIQLTFPSLSFSPSSLKS